MQNQIFFKLIDGFWKERSIFRIYKYKQNIIYSHIINLTYIIV